MESYGGFMAQEQMIRIRNFRCFQYLEVKGFKRVNLIGGQNNIGKTSLLEALSLYFYPNSSGISCIKKTRKESDHELKKQPQNAWNNFFYKQINTEHIVINGDFNENPQNIIISVYDTIPSRIFEDAFEDLEIKELAKKVVDLFIESNSPKSTLEIQQGVSSVNLHPFKRYLIAHNRGIFAPDLTHQEKLPFISSSYQLSNEEIAQKYDRVDFEGKGKEVLKLLQTLDESIEGLRTYSHIEPTLYLQTKIKKRGLPIALFGDAIYRITAITLELLSQENNVLFIDEIENGIHHTNQKKFWQALFKLSNQLNTMIFATTHSLEMIQAFMQAGYEFPDQGAYIELARDPRTDDIVAITRDTEVLEYDLERNKPVRGE